MKKLIIVLAIAATGTSLVAQNNWSIGVYTAGIGNHSKYSGGMSDANALFNHTKFGSVSLGFRARYYFTKHWSVQSGLNNSRIGFEYALAKDYSFLKRGSHYSTNRIGISALQVPLTAIYTSKPNCLNVSWYVGAGVAFTGHLRSVNKTKTTAPSANSEGVTTSDNIEQTVTSGRFAAITGQLMFGIQKQLNRGSIIQFGFTGNRGFSTVASSTVSYSVDGKAYTHTFANKGNYAGMTLSYYFKPFNKKK